MTKKRLAGDELLDQLNELIIRQVDKEGESETIRFTLPKLEFHYHPLLIYKAYWYWQNSNALLPPAHEDIALIDSDYDADLRTMHDLIRYQADYKKRPAPFQF